ncbi:hypothetical protein TNIN_264431 [Trichonephila inaurata madagascariensis]|uniref:Uncharacterized protein n=1 Tax=Trichonephila inaurata madagascariensis TaxID=2747483 RepID=A0A8X6IBG6_9ARAC|nr:hypothetical protein TNIN_264431 [Trichonephila inaurata madagascariensis]
MGCSTPPARRSLDKEQKGLRGDFSGSGNGGFQQFWFRDKEKPRRTNSHPDVRSNPVVGNKVISSTSKRMCMRDILRPVKLIGIVLGNSIEIRGLETDNLLWLYCFGRKSDSPSLKGNVSPIDSLCLFFLKANDGAVVCWNCYPIDCVLGMLRKCSLRAVGNTDFAWLVSNNVEI